MTDASVTLARLDDQLAWYDRKSRRAQRIFKALKFTTIVIAAAIPLVGYFIRDPKIILSILGALVLVIESVQGLNQYQQLWITYRATAESLKHEKYLHAAGAGPYAQDPNPDRLLAEHVEALVSQEHARWVQSTEKATAKKPSS
jgi:hypothetical protein